MEKIKKKEIEKIEKMMEKEFPQDPALQQVHIARKIISKEAESAGLSFSEYIKLLARQGKDIR
jgi:cobalamin biosynthesis Co2+ chelatase CbiK